LPGGKPLLEPADMAFLTNKVDHIRGTLATGREMPRGAGDSLTGTSDHRHAVGRRRRNADVTLPLRLHKPASPFNA
jgi:hypothetical protein